MLGSGRVKRGAAFAGERIGEGRQRRRELAGDEGVEGAEAGGEFGVGEAAPAVEAAEEVLGGGLPLFRVAIATARNEVAVGIAPRLSARDDMVDGAYEDGAAAQAVKQRPRSREWMAWRRALFLKKSASAMLAARGSRAAPRAAVI